MAHKLFTVTPSSGADAFAISEKTIVFGIESGTGTILRLITGQNVEKNVLVDEDPAAIAALMRYPLELTLSTGEALILAADRVLTVETYGADSIVKVLGLKEKKFVVDETPTAIKTLVNDLVNPDLP